MPQILPLRHRRLVLARNASETAAVEPGSRRASCATPSRSICNPYRTMTSQRWPGTLARDASLGPIKCAACQKVLPGPRPSDGVVVCADHDVVGCDACLRATHGSCRRELGLGARLLRQVEFRYLLNYVQFAARMKSEVARWIASGFRSAPAGTDPRYLALEVLALYMAATEDLSILLDSFRSRLVTSPPKETLLETLLDSRQGALPRFLDTVHRPEDVGAYVGLDFVKDARIPGVDATALHEAVARAIFATAFGSPTEQPNWRPLRWRAYNKMKHGGIVVSDAARVLDIPSFSRGPGALDWMDEGKTRVPSVLSFEIDGKDPDGWVDLIRHLGVTQQVLVLCYLMRFHDVELRAAAPQGNLDALLSAPRIRECVEFFRKVAPAQK